MRTLPSGPSFKGKKSQWSIITAYQTKNCSHTLFHWSATTCSFATLMATLQTRDVMISIAEERVSNQNGVSLLYIMLEIHYSGREPLEVKDWIIENSLILINRSDDQPIASFPRVEDIEHL